ncbi:hypothetical protein [Rheinheimera maricola]|uniref:Nuclear transport factor 2 family protein n=1 Tax=Rheinheimera maricola TaxID=2793282 RepID=A0ABS7XGI5_9GAMM|nr:hypothetical protein [Rheinheimera maricola]MBZ9613768.1 hypothetical protein [Rheinheimera maricola]
MKYKVGILSVLVMLFTAAVRAESDPQNFFQNYTRLGDDFNPMVAELYDDSAKIHAYRVYPHGLERNMEFTGAQWKELVKKVMPLAKLQNDNSTFSDIKISEIEGGYKLKANRYSKRKCYTDTGYYMILKKQENGSLAILEEYMETKPLPNC